jgi:hypothetical protein
MKQKTKANKSELMKKAPPYKADPSLQEAAAKGEAVLKIKAKKPKPTVPKILKPQSGMTYIFKVGLIRALYSGKYHKIDGAIHAEGSHVCVMGAIGMQRYGKKKFLKLREEGEYRTGDNELDEHAIGAAVGLTEEEVDKLVSINDDGFHNEEGDYTESNFIKLADYINENL